MYELLLLVAVVLLAKYIINKGYKNENYFKERGIKHLKPYFIVGNSGNIFSRKRTIYEFFNDAYSTFPNEKLMGLLEFRSPLVFLRDPELVKQLVLKEFDHFSERRNMFGSDSEPTFGKSLFLLRGEEWKEMRSTLSPAFTGSKMRLMFELVSQCTNQMVDFINKENKEKGIQSYEMKDFCSRMANDIIATCAFGIQVNSLENQKNEFYEKGKDITNFFTIFRLIKIVLFMNFPKFCNALKMKIFPVDSVGYFKNAIVNAMNYRDKNNVVRPDMIHLLMEAKKGKLSHQNLPKSQDSAGFATVEESHVGRQEGKKDLTENDIVAQCFIFFFAGFDTTSTALSFLCYELAVNPEIQDKVFAEIQEINIELGQESLNYDAIQKMKYMDMVVSESLRKWPPLPFVDRLCTKEFVLDDGKGFTYKFEKDYAFVVPMVSFHRDPQYYPDPDKFDPERFSDENKHKIVPGTYLPFGIGPRNCIGSRFALMEVKAIMYYILMNFKIEPTEKTQIPLKLRTSGMMVTEKGIWVQFTPRSQV